MAEASIALAVLKLGNVLIEKDVFLRGVEGEVQWLKDELKRMQCFLKDAAEKQAKDERVRNWISEIREVAQDAEDAIEMFILKVENGTRSRGRMERWASFPNHVYYLNKVRKEIESIRKRLRDIETSRLKYGIQDLGEGVDSSGRWDDEVEARRRLAHWQKDKDVVGLDEDVKLLLEKAILEEREGLSTATIEGMGGIGKSTLARLVYNHTDVTKRFERRGWVVVSSEFRPREIMKELILQLLEPTENKLIVLETMEKLEARNLQQMLYERLQGKRYLIVLDDVWEDTHWEALASAFPDEDKGSRLILTSRNRVITKFTRYMHKMKTLDHSKSWELFLKKAFIANTDGQCPEDLKNTGEEILKKCNGLPLAISVVGGLLAKRTQSKNEWEKVLKGINSHLERNGSNVSAILELSYLNLPPQLKPCFLCLSFFEEDAAIRTKKLIHIWIAQGFVPQGRGEETMEEISRSCLDELINRNLVQIKDMSKDDRVKTCQVHDLLHELSIKRAKEEISFEILKKNPNTSTTSQSSLDKPRHRAVFYRGIMGAGFIDSSSVNPNIKRIRRLRSLFFHGDGGFFSISPSYNWKSFELLRVLEFEGFHLLKSLPKAIGTLIGLRYLGLRGTFIMKIPSSLGRLKNLEVLDIWNYPAKMPNVIWKIDSLRHLYALAISWELPLKINTPKNLQTLSCIPLTDLDLEQLKQLTSLCKLGIDISKISDMSNLFTSLAMLENLVCLNLRGCRDSQNMDKIVTLHRITKLRLDGTISMLRSASNFPPNLLYLSMINTNLGEDPMPELEKLPKLLYLKLDKAYTGEVMVISHHGFPKLRVLSLRKLFELRNIQIENGAISELKRLKIKECQNLREEVRVISLRLES